MFAYSLSLTCRITIKYIEIAIEKCFHFYGNNKGDRDDSTAPTVGADTEEDGAPDITSSGVPQTQTMAVERLWQ